MLIERLKTPGLAQHSYLFGCGEGTAIVVDPRRDIDVYLHAARDNGLSIAYILETHRQEDFESGAAALAQLTGAKMVAGSHELFGRSELQLSDGAELRAGETRFVLLDTPGHTPESVCYAVYPDQTRSACWGVFTGDTLFAGATGRTDLTDPARTGHYAGLLFDSVHARLAGLGDGALLFACHGPGSACGSNIADREHTTLGIEKATNPVFLRSRGAFIDEKCRERIPRPPYFSLMEQLNLGGGRPLAYPHDTRALPPRAFQAAVQSAMIIDVRVPEAFAACHLPGSYNIWLGGLPTFAGWLADETTKVYLVLNSAQELPAAELALVRIGLNWPEAVLAGGVVAWREQGLPVSSFATISAAESHDAIRRENIRILDVRDQSEWEQGHIPGALHLYVGELKSQLPDVPKNEPLIVHCSVGNRAGLAASLLERAGFKDVRNMLGGMKAWRNIGLPVETN